MVYAKKILLLSGLVLMGILVITILPKSRNGDEGWIYYGKSEERTCYYNVHAVTLLAEGNISLRTREMYGETGEVKRNMWRTEFGNLIEEKDTFTHADRLLEIDCRQKEFKVFRVVEYNKVGQAFDLYQDPEKRYPIQKGSAEENLYRIVCQDILR
jgi:hypothetical protein